jgi:lysophospholipase L1-like esterase
MSHTNVRGTLSLGLLSLAACATTPEIPPGEDPLEWQEKVEVFEAAALDSPPPAEAALFIGSSSIRRWDTLHEDMAPLPVIKRGFGGSRLFDSVYWADRLVLVHDPAVIVMFSGTNDLKGDEPKSAARLCMLFEQFVARIRDGGCDAPIVYIAISPSKKRIEHFDLVLEANGQIASYCDTDESLHFVDTATSLLNDWGQPDMQWFDEDELHLNARGYALWTAHIKPLITRLLRATG